MNRVRCLLILILIFSIHSVVIAHMEVKFLEEFGGKGERAGQFSQELFVAFDRHGGIYITDTDNVRIQKFNGAEQLQFEIRPIAEQFRLIKPTHTAVGPDGTIYVIDWILVPIQGSCAPRIFNYGPCVHRFDSEGEFVASYPLQDLSQRMNPIESASPGLDAEGNYALIIPQGDTMRSFLLTVDAGGNIYVLDDGVIYKLNSDGVPIVNFSVSQPKAGQIVRAVDMVTDSHGHLYLVDGDAHRVLKYDSEGKFLTAFGQYGSRPGQFISPFLIRVLDDGTILVADRAKFRADYVSDLPQRQFDPFQFSALPYRIFRTRLRRVQRFSSAGEYDDKILIRFSRENETYSHLRLKAIDYSGNLYFIDKETLKFKKFSPTSGLIASAFQTEAQLRYTMEFHDAEIDNRDDLDADFFTGADFDERVVLNEANAKVTFVCVVNEDFRCSISNSFACLWISDKRFYRARDFEDFRGSFNQDDESNQVFWDNRIQLGLSVTRDHNPYRYRQAQGFVYVNVTRNDFMNNALTSNNSRFFDFQARISDWGGGINYGFSRALQIQFEVGRLVGYNGYSYVDETDNLYATGFQENGFTLALLTVDGIF